MVHLDKNRVERNNIQMHILVLYFSVKSLSSVLLWKSTNFDYTLS